jgi:CubicO group peptidase (beta-lactamase class C family)
MTNARTAATCLASVILMFIDCATAAVPATKPAGAVLPRTEAGQLISDWMKVCAAPTLKQLRRWTANHLSSANIGRMSADDQAQWYFEFCTANGGLRVTEIERSDTRSVSLVMVSAKSDVWFNMSIATDDSGKLEQAFVEPTTPPESTMPKDLSDAAIAREVKQRVSRLAKAGVFSGIVTVARGTQIIASASGGYADRERKTPITGATQFALGSMGKLFTAAAVGQLVDQKKIAFDATVGQFFPDYPNPTVRDKVTVGMLLSHTAGLGDFLPKRTPEMRRDGVKRAADFMPLYDHDELKFAPGTSWGYSNAGEALAGAIVEKASGEDYPDYLRQHIFTAAGMENSDPDNIPLVSDKLVVPYTKASPNGRFAEWHVAERSGGSPAGGAISTADDLVRFANALRGGKLMSQATFAEMSKPHANGGAGGSYGYAIGIHSTYGRTFVGHNGGFPGVNTEIFIFLDLPYTVVVLANQDPPAESYPASTIAAMIAEKVKRSQSH